MGEPAGHPFRGNQWTTSRKTGAFPLHEGNVSIEPYSVFVHGADGELDDAAFRKLTKEYGRELGLYEAAACAGVLPGEVITRMSFEDGSIRIQSRKMKKITAFGADREEPLYYKDRSLMLSTGVVYNESFMSKERNAGHGTKMMLQQVAAASAHGFKEISVYAAGSGPLPPSRRTPGMVVPQSNTDSNGYYTWARLGFMPVAVHAGAKVSESVVGPSGKISNLNWIKMMSTKSGRDWWKAHGHSFSGKFDLTEGSVSRRALEGYAREKGL